MVNFHPRSKPKLWPKHQKSDCKALKSPQKAYKSLHNLKTKILGYHDISPPPVATEEN